MVRTLLLSHALRNSSSPKLEEGGVYGLSPYPSLPILLPSSRAILILELEVFDGKKENIERLPIIGNFFQLLVENI